MQGEIGETYNIGGHNEQANIDVVRSICALLEEMAPQKPAGVANYADLITFVADRPWPRCALCHRCGQNRPRIELAAAGAFESGLRKPCAGISTTAHGGSMCSAALTA